MFKTDIENVFLVDITDYHSNSPIQNMLPSIEASLFAEFAIRDQFIYNVLLHIIKENSKLLSLNHCKDLHKMANKLTQIHRIIGSSNLEAFAFVSGLNKFLIPIADTIVSFECQPRLLQPRKLNDNTDICYMNLPVVYKINGAMAFINSEKIITSSGIQIPCDPHFSAAYEMLNGEFITSTPKGHFTVNVEDDWDYLWQRENMTDFKFNLSFGQGDGLYTMNAIKDKMNFLTFNAASRTILRRITLQTDDTRDSQGAIGINKMFTKLSLNSVLEQVGRYTSIFIACVSIIMVVKALVVYCVDMVPVHRILGSQDKGFWTYTVSTNDFILKNTQYNKPNNQIHENAQPLSFLPMLSPTAPIQTIVQNTNHEK